MTRFGSSDSQRHKLVDRLEQLERVLVRSFGSNQVLEDAQHGCELVRSDNALRTLGQERPQQSHEGRNIASRLPQRRRQQRWQQRLVRVGQVGVGVQLEQLGQELEHERRKLGNVLLKDCLERREKRLFELGQRGRVGGRDEPDMTSNVSKTQNLQSQYLIT